MGVMRLSRVGMLLVKHRMDSLSRDRHNQAKVTLIPRTPLINNPSLTFEMPGFDKEPGVKASIKPILI